MRQCVSLKTPRSDELSVCNVRVVCCPVLLFELTNEDGDWANRTLSNIVKNHVPVQEWC